MNESLMTAIALGVAVAGISFWPRHGLLARWQAGRQIRTRTQIEDGLKHIHTLNQRGAPANPESLAGALRQPLPSIFRLIERMQSEGLVECVDGGLRLTPAGNDWALHVIRAHRLWERYLADQAGWPLTHLHAEADRREHSSSAADLEAMEANLGYPRRDPHGDPIPTESGELADDPHLPLTQWPPNVPGTIAHIEDEPAEVFAQIVAQGLKPGLAVRLIALSPTRVVFEAGETQHVLAPIIAANIFVAPLLPAVSLAGKPLSTLRLGESARILTLSDSAQGLTRRRFLDLGLTPGTVVEAALPNPFKDPIAYRVRDTLIALRREQADQILIDPETTRTSS
jgi:DtxR family Mn-dependent transcriptional regulator